LDLWLHLIENLGRCVRLVSNDDFLELKSQHEPGSQGNNEHQNQDQDKDETSSLLYLLDSQFSFRTYAQFKIML